MGGSGTTLLASSTLCGEEAVSPTIRIVPYDSTWPEEFHSVALPLRQALSALAMRIDHIGSTSVPGLPAKDIIDVQVTVAVLDGLTISDALAPLGYMIHNGIAGDHIPPDWDPSPEQWRKLYFYAPSHQRATHLHVRQAGRANQLYPILFRDYLRVTPAASRAYAQVKQALATLHPDDVAAYYDVKDPVCDIIMAGATRWAADTQYAPGPSDL